MNTTQPQSPLDQYKITIDKVFTFENLTAILAVVQSLKPAYDEPRIKETEFETIVFNSEVNGMDKISKGIVDFVNKRAQIIVK